MTETNNNKNTITSTKQAMAFVGMVVVAGIYVLTQYLMPQYDYEQKLAEASRVLIAKSPAHKQLVESYLQCRTKSFRNSSRAQCIQQMYELSEAEGLQDKFDQVSRDIKNELWLIKRND